MFYIKSFLLLVAHICRSTKMCRYTVSIVLLRSVMNNGDNEIKEKNGRSSVPRPYSIGVGTGGGHRGHVPPLKYFFSIVPPLVLHACNNSHDSDHYCWSLCWTSSCPRTVRRKRQVHDCDNSMKICVIIIVCWRKITLKKSARFARALLIILVPPLSEYASYASVTNTQILRTPLALWQGMLGVSRCMNAHAER